MITLTMLLTAPVLILLSGCATAEREGTLRPCDVVFFSTEGKNVATATFFLPALGPAASRFTGTWQLHSSERGFPDIAVAPGTYAAEAANDIWRINLNPRAEENNVILLARIGENALSGQWLHRTRAGERVLGTFYPAPPGR